MQNMLDVADSNFIEFENTNSSLIMVESNSKVSKLEKLFAEFVDLVKDGFTEEETTLALPILDNFIECAEIAIDESYLDSE